jgi:hypothetical protein
MTMQILIVHQDFQFVLLTYSKFVIYFCIVYKCDYKLQISEWICSYCKLIPIFEHYKCIVNAFAWLSNLVPSAVLAVNAFLLSNAAVLSQQTMPDLYISQILLQSYRNVIIQERICNGSKFFCKP